MSRLGPVAMALAAGTVVGALLARPLADQASFASSPDALLSLDAAQQVVANIKRDRIAARRATTPTTTTPTTTTTTTTTTPPATAN